MRTTKGTKLGYNAFVVIVLAAVLIYALSRWVHLGRVEYTDDAQVQRHITPVNNRVQGFIREVRFEEYRRVKRGDTLVLIEREPYVLQHAQAVANLEAARKGSTVITAGMNTTDSNVRIAEAGIDEARVNMENAEREYNRYAALVESGTVTQQEFDNKRTIYESAKARYEQASASLNSTSLVKGEQQNRLTQNQSTIEMCEAAVELAELNLSYTAVVATANGVIGRKDIHEGQLVQPGQLLAQIVEDDEVWVIANYRETQMQHIGIGSEATFTADAIDDVEYQGVVESISPATGSGYSHVAADNATGNFIKVEQRVPVRIRITTEADTLRRLLLSGLNVETEVKY